MKKIYKFLFLGLFVTAFISSCTIEKRLHNSGYHVMWKNGKHASDANENLAKVEDNDVTSKENISISQVPSVQTEEITTTASISTEQEAVNAPENTVVNQSVKKENATSSAVRSTETKKTASLSFKKTIIKQAARKLTSNKNNAPDEILLIILCFFIPPVAVGLKTDWDTRTVVINILLTLLCGIPGIIHALIVFLD